MKGKADSPCFGCDERHPGCHGECAEYAACREERERRRAEEYRLRVIGDGVKVL